MRARTGKRRAPRPGGEAGESGALGGDRALGQECGTLTPRFRLWLSTADDRSPFGHGKWRLLATIEREGSLRASAAALGISYRKAWGDLRKAERLLGIKLTTPQRGGTSGGRTALTEEGRRLLRAYDRFEAEVSEAVARAFRSSFAEMRP